MTQRTPADLYCSPLATARELGLKLHDLQLMTYPLSEHGYGRRVLIRTAEREVVAIHWPRGSRSPLHGHGQSAAALEVLGGALIENHFLPNPDDPERPWSFASVPLGSLSSITLPVGGVHAVEAITESWGLHVYRPELADPTAPISEYLIPQLVKAWRSAADRTGSDELPWFLQQGGLVQRSAGDPRSGPEVEPES